MSESVNANLRPLELIDLKEVVTLILKKKEIHEGLYAAQVQFQISIGNFGMNNENVYPTAMVGISHFGISQVEEATPFTVDAAVVNPRT